jgi:hypothetical protein
MFLGLLKQEEEDFPPIGVLLQRAGCPGPSVGFYREQQPQLVLGESRRQTSSFQPVIQHLQWTALPLEYPSNSLRNVPPDAH